jgi:hypothetical protein
LHLDLTALKTDRQIARACSSGPLLISLAEDNGCLSKARLGMCNRLRVLLMWVCLAIDRKAVNNKSLSLSRQGGLIQRISLWSTLSPSMPGVTAVTFYNLTNLVESHICRQKSFRPDLPGGLQPAPASRLRWAYALQSSN